jgi:hypothetical protein
MLKTLTYLIWLTIAAGCASNEGRFVFNDSILRVDQSRLAHFRASWSSTSSAIAAKSGISERNKVWTFDFIATVEANGVAPCTRLDLLAVDIRELTQITARDRDGSPVVFTPQTYNEIWQVAACGKTRRWQVFDEASDPRKSHQVILFSTV